MRHITFNFIRMNIVLLLLASNNILFASDSMNDEFTITPNFKLNETYLIIADNRRIKTKDGATILTTSGSSSIRLKILEANKDYYIVESIQGDTTIHTPGLSENEFIKTMANLSKGTKVVFRIQRNGVIAGIENWDELKTATEKMMEAFYSKIPAIAKSEQEKQALQNAIDSTKNMFNNRANVEQTYLSTYNMIFLPLGPTFNKSVSTQYEDLLPNLFGGAPFPSVATFTVSKYSPKSDNVEILWNQTLQKEQSAKILLDSFRMHNPNIGITQIPPVDIKDDAIFNINRSTGWVTRARFMRITEIGNTRQEDVTEYSLKGL